MERITFVKKSGVTPPWHLGDMLLPEMQENSSKPGDYWFYASEKPSVKSWAPAGLIPLRALGPNNWDVLTYTLGVEDFRSRVEYSCHSISGDNKYYWFIPLFLSFGNKEFWASRVRTIAEAHSRMPYWIKRFEYVFDNSMEYVKQLDEDINHSDTIRPYVPMTDIERSLIGHGYTDFTLPHDGSGYMYAALASLSNGDEILGNVWVWCNK